MPRGIHGQAAELLQGAKTGDRYVDLAVDLREWDGTTSIICVGGMWDRQEREWVGDSESAAVLKLQPSQYEAGRWFADWMRAYAAGERVADFSDVYVLMAEGGRGAGKTDFAAKALVVFAVAMQDRIAWAVSPIFDEADELSRAISKNLSPSWYQWREGSRTWALWNGSTIQLLSSHTPGSLKRGRADMWLLNEGQRMSKLAYEMARPRLADTAGLGIITANPPRDARGRWILEFHDAALGGALRDVHLVEFDNRKNPTIDWRSLELLKDGFGEKDYRREVMGEFIPIGDIVFYAWSSMPSGNIRPAPEVGKVTRQFTQRHLGREFDHVVGVDFQISPHMAAVVAEFYNDPDDPTEPLMWFTDEAVIEGTEDDLIDLLESKGYEPARTAVVADASGEWQDAERTKGRGSFDLFRRRGWTFISRPDRKAKVNPIIAERIAATNARMCNSRGVRKLFAVPGLHFWNRAAKNWENKHGTPYRRSEFAHMCDAGSYVVWRFFPRMLTSGTLSYKRIQRKRSKRELDLDRF